MAKVVRKMFRHTRDSDTVVLLVVANFGLALRRYIQKMTAARILKSR
jgi:hypothetical protein